MTDDYISRQVVLEGIASIAKAKARSDAQKSLMGRVMFFTEQLPSVTPQPCDDYISRQAVNEGFKKYDNSSFAYGCMWDYINKLPPVTPKEKTGRWIYDKKIENWRCSECNEIPRTMGYVGTADFMAEHFNFCNHCGAKMQDMVVIRER